MKKKSPRNSLATPGNSRLRIIGGQWRGRKLPIPELDGLRPTGDRLRETLFNWLMPELPQSRCLDLFAGSGALGLEALSRGAAAVTLVERHRQAAAQLRENCATLTASGAEVIEADAIHWLADYRGPKFDIVFVDPPFAADLWLQVTDLLRISSAVGEGTLLYMETPKDKQVPMPTGWESVKYKSMGSVCAHLYRLVESAPAFDAP